MSDPVDATSGLDWIGPERNTAEDGLMQKQRFRRLTDLFIVGKPVRLPDDTYMWVQALNTYQRDEAVSDAQVARARVVMAMREMGDERQRIEARFYVVGRDAAIKDLAQTKVQEKITDFVETLRANPEWKERLEILLNTDESDTAEQVSADEVALLAKINGEVLAELKRLEDLEREYQISRLDSLPDEDLVQEWIEAWLDQRGTAVASAEYKMTELWYSARFCNATIDTDGTMNHSECDSHVERVFEARQDVKAAPDELVELVQAALEDLNLGGRDPKDSVNPPSSSEPSPTPSAEGASKGSTSDGTSTEPPGTSSTPSPTP